MKQIIWTKEDNFDTMHQKIKDSEGCSVVNKQYPEKPLMIFKVEEIEPSEIEFTNYNGKSKGFDDSTGNGFIQKSRNVWRFLVEFGHENKKGQRVIMQYNFIIPRNSDYKEDLKKTTIMVDENHPFIFY